VEISFEAVLLKFVRSCSEGICFDDISAGSYIFRVNLTYEIGIAEVKFIVTTVDVDAFGIKHRAHRAVEDVDAVSFEKFFKGLHKIEDCKCPICFCLSRSCFERWFENTDKLKHIGKGNKNVPR
jgi:hypothetical protein